MTEPPKHRPWPLLGSLWLALCGAHTLLQCLAPRSLLSDPLLSAWARVSLLATEYSMIAAVLLALAALSRLLSAGAARISPKLAVAALVVRSFLAALLLLTLAVSWSMFWLSGQFLDPSGLRFATGNLGTMLGFASRLHPFLMYGMPWLLLALSSVACVLLPRAISRLPSKIGLGAAWGSAALAGLTLAAAAVGELQHRSSTEKITDPVTGAVYSRDDLYRLRRDRNAGPLTHWIAKSVGSRDPLDSTEGDRPVGIVRRPRIPLPQYLSAVDPARLHRWNVVVLLVDSLRSDQLRATGGSRDVMPTVEALAREGTVFTDCVTTATHTDYAVPAVFSSHYPLRSRDVYRYPKDPPYPRVMIYDVLKALGWRTALFSSQNEEWGQMINYVQTGGLDVYFHAGTAGMPEAPTKDRPAFSAALDDAVTMSEALNWIGTESSAPFFLALNLQNSHLPYDVPKDFARRFAPTTLDFKISIGWYPEEKTAIVKDVYADSLAYVDVQIERLFRRLKDLGQWERTLVVVTGDHGEAFYEHGTAAHANGVHEEVIRVPLILRAPGRPGGRDGRPAQLLDVAPGVFHLLGLPPHPSFQGADPFDSVFRSDRSRFLISDTPWKTQMGVLRAGFKLIRDGDTGGSVLYDLAIDPWEKRDATDAHPAIARDLSGRLSAWRRAQLEYYENVLRQGREYPPVLGED
ncbi:MAG: sulfatase [Planctomycetaceae bacterium]|nr:sulfatase [Planctomycetaceae bacterium]